jgi:hypothetical protein
MTKIAICYWGMTRSTKYVYNSHFNNLFNVLKNNSFDYKVFMHTWKVENDQNIIWENVSNIPIDYQEYTLLQPDFYKIEDQKLFKDTLKFSDYFNKELYDKYGGDTPNEWRPQLIMNHLCALESQKRVYQTVNNMSEKFDYIIFIRPDVLLLNKLDINIFNNRFDIAIPNYDHNEGLNDRFAILPFNNAHNYACRINEIKEFRKNNGRIVSEKYVKFIINKYYNNLKFIDFKMKIVRPNGLKEV